jgi:hypothetical protein
MYKETLNNKHLIIMKKEDRISRIIARGEFSNHSHVVTGDATIERNNSGQILIHVGNEGAVIKHILESNWLSGEEVWTEEHTDIMLAPTKVDEPYVYVPQKEYNPFDKIIERVMD